MPCIQSVSVPAYQSHAHPRSFFTPLSVSHFFVFFLSDCLVEGNPVFHPTTLIPITPTYHHARTYLHPFWVPRPYDLQPPRSDRYPMRRPGLSSILSNSPWITGPISSCVSAINYELFFVTHVFRNELVLFSDHGCNWLAHTKSHQSSVIRQKRRLKSTPHISLFLWQRYVLLTFGIFFGLMIEDWWLFVPAVKPRKLSVIPEDVWYHMLFEGESSVVFFLETVYNTKIWLGLNDIFIHLKKIVLFY